MASLFTESQPCFPSFSSLFPPIMKSYHFRFWNTYQIYPRLSIWSSALLGPVSVMSFTDYFRSVLSSLSSFPCLLRSSSCQRKWVPSAVCLHGTHIFLYITFPIILLYIYNLIIIFINYKICLSHWTISFWKAGTVIFIDTFFIYNINIV